MDIVSLAMNMSQASLVTEVSTSLTKIAMNDGAQAATKMTDMMAEAVDSNLGNKIDVRV